MTNVHFKSEIDTWETPVELFRRLDAEFRFDLDVCALPATAKCARYFTPEEDGLAQRWEGVCWMNPPYGRQITHWMRKAFEESQGGATVVCLVPARTDTEWWHQYALRGEIRFLRGRLRFGAAAARRFRRRLSFSGTVGGNAVKTTSPIRNATIMNQ